MDNLLFCGCDVGSTYGKAVIMNQDGILLGHTIVRSRLKPEETAIEAIAAAKANAGVSVRDTEPFTYLVGTGYGRDLVPFANANISEISCHAMGVHVLAPSVRTIIDFGGQDLKGISVDGKGMVTNFVMNDKCAAGTGRFFEAMANAFSMSIEEFSALSLDAREEIPITSQCSVFAETEVISLIARSKRPEDIALGIEASVARRAYALLRNTGIQPDLAVTGGCSKNTGLLQCLKSTFNLTFVDLPADPQLAGAIGAAEYARIKSGAANRN
jgi:predicted CoA-substrate-specific enzyme activase